MGLPAGFRLVDAFLSPAEEAALGTIVAGLDYEPVVLHGQAARRVVHHFGLSYTYGSGEVAPTEPIPAWLDDVRARAAALAGVEPEAFVEALVTRFPPGASIGWHRDAPAFGSAVVGISLGGPALLRFRRRRRGDDGFDRAEVELPSGSAYLLAGTARWSWQHHIPPVPAERHSVTFRTAR